MIDIFLLCLIAVNAADCTTLHPSLDQFIPKDLLPENNELHSSLSINCMYTCMNVFTSTTEIINYKYAQN